MLYSNIKYSHAHDSFTILCSLLFKIVTGGIISGHIGVIVLEDTIENKNIVIYNKYYVLRFVLGSTD